jgi:NAD(P)-dependent dehydrogenase (short-subunit alcohol dehydrogenase family)
MINKQFQGMSVLVTGGTRGLGKAIGTEFARHGASVILTHRWGSVDENELIAEFREQNLQAPHIIECDVSDLEATRALMTLIKEQVGGLDVFISNVAFSKVINDLQDLKQNSLNISLGYSAWPLVEYIKMTKDVIGQFPRYAIAISNDGAEVCHDGYDLAGVSKAVLETLCRYLALRLKKHGVRVNALRSGFLDTASSRATFGEKGIRSLADRAEGFIHKPEDVARVCLALCSGLMDAVTGQVIVVDEGWSLVSPLAYLTGRGLPGSFPDGEEES